MRVALLLALAVLLAGCVPGNLEGVVKEMAKSDRSWCMAATGYGVNLKIGGSGVGDGDMACSDGGLALKSQSNQVGVPLTIVPQLSIGPPALVPPPPRPVPVPRVAPQSAPASPRDRMLLPIQWEPEDGPEHFLSDAAVLEILRAVGALHRGAP